MRKCFTKECWADLDDEGMCSACAKKEVKKEVIKMIEDIQEGMEEVGNEHMTQQASAVYDVFDILKGKVKLIEEN